METIRKYPIGIQTFSKIIERDCVYVDKTALVYQLAQDNCYYFLSRPRRFGKSLLITTLEAYFQGRKELFEGLAISKLEKDWTVYPVLHIDLNPANYCDVEALQSILSYQLGYFEKTYGPAQSGLSVSEKFMEVIRNAYEQTGQQIISFSFYSTETSTAQSREFYTGYG